MPAGTDGGPDGFLVSSTGMSSRGFLVVDRRRVCAPFVCFLTCIDFGAFPPPVIIVAAPAPPPPPGGGKLPPVSTFIGSLLSDCFPLFLTRLFPNSAR